MGPEVVKCTPPERIVGPDVEKCTPLERIVGPEFEKCTPLERIVGSEVEKFAALKRNVVRSHARGDAVGAGRRGCGLSRKNTRSKNV